jgi:radical SAM superfamily enzyme YgiQ (UPF0313 family)
MKIAFVHCPDRGYARQQNYGARFMPAWAFTLAAHVPAELQPQLELYDLALLEAESIAAADVFLFSGINQDQDFIGETSRGLRLRFPWAKQLLGGPIAWSFDQAGELERLEGFDHVCIGDGELLLPRVLRAVAAGETLPWRLVAPGRFPLDQALPMHQGLLARWAGSYYAGVVSVARGCPFLCEFCDIRVLEDNNVTRSKDPEAVLEDIDFLVGQGVCKINLACDNFIGDLRWAEQMVERLLRWQRETGRSASFYTWVTTNLNRHPKLMEMMREAGFEMLFLGIESFDEGALSETAKVQNNVAIPEAMATIQSYGFIIIAGLIIGFDSDRPDFAETMLQGLEDSGLISGDPNWLTALPGTPLHRRMELSGRLRDAQGTIGGKKYETNLRYLLPAEVLIAGFRRFVDAYLSGGYQYRRFAKLLSILERGNYIPTRSRSFIDPVHLLRQSLRDPLAVAQHLERLWHMLAKPERGLNLLRGLHLAWTKRGRVEGWLGYFQFWMFTWSNALFKYGAVGDDEFDIESVAPDYPLEEILPEGYEGTAGGEASSRDRVLYRHTRAQLERVIARRGRRREVSDGQ